MTDEITSRDVVVVVDMVVDGRGHDWVVDSGARPVFACAVAPVPGD